MYYNMHLWIVIYIVINRINFQMLFSSNLQILIPAKQIIYTEFLRILST